MNSNLGQDEAVEGPAPAQPAMKGDLTQGPIFGTMIRFAIPMLIGNIIQTLNGSINAIWVGRLIGESALAATANANMIMFLMIAAVFGLGNATTVRVGQYFGHRNIDAARRTFGSGVGFSTVISVIASILGWAFSTKLLHLMATPAASFAEAEAYLQVIFITLPFGMVSFMLGMALRGVGDAKTPLYSMILVVVLDIALNPLLILGLGPIPALGIAGSALASGLANFAGIALILWRTYAHNLPIRLKGREFRYLIPTRPELAYIVGKGMPMGTQMLLMSSAQLVVIGLVNREGMHTTAAYGASLQLWNYLQMPAFAISMAISAMVAQNIGAGHHERVAEITRVGMWANLAMTGLLSVAVVAASHPLLALFLGGQSEALPIAQHIQYLVTWSYIVMGAMMVQGGTLRAYGVVIAPMIIQAITLYPVRLGFYFGLYPTLGADALWWSFPASSLISAGSIWFIYRYGSWQHRKEQAFPGAAQPVAEVAPH